MFFRRFPSQAISSFSTLSVTAQRGSKSVVQGNIRRHFSNTMPINSVNILKKAPSSSILLFAAGVATGVAGVELYHQRQPHLAVDNVYFDIHRHIKEKNALSISLIASSRPLGTEKEFLEYSNSLFMSLEKVISKHSGDRSSVVLVCGGFGKKDSGMYAHKVASQMLAEKYPSVNFTLNCCNIDGGFPDELIDEKKNEEI